MPKEAIIAIGLARPLPAISGAEPCTGSYKALRFLVLASTSPSDAEGAGEHRGNVGEHVAEQVVGHDNVELFGPAHELHAAGVRQLMFELDVLELSRMHLFDDF